MPHRAIVLFCGMLIATTAVSTDVLLPGLFAMSAALDAPIGEVQIVIPVFLFSAGLGQLVFGPLSDRFGRRPVLMTGLCLYTVGAAMAAVSTELSPIIIARIIQGLGGSAGIAVGRAMLRDLHQGPALAQAMALATSLVSVGPILAPIVGVALVAAGGWRLPFVAMVVFGVGMLLAALAIVPETHTERDPQGLRPSVLAANYARVFRHPQSRMFLLTSAVMGSTILVFLTHSSRLMKGTFGVEGMGFAALFALMGAGIVVGQTANRHVIPRLGVLAATRAGASVIVGVGVALLLLELSGMMSVWVFAALMFTFNTSYLVVMSNSLSLAIDPHKDIAGLVASLFGFLTMVVPGALAMATLPLIAGQMLPFAATLLGLASLVLAAVMSYRPATASAPAA